MEFHNPNDHFLFYLLKIKSKTAPLSYKESKEMSRLTALYEKSITNVEDYIVSRLSHLKLIHDKNLINTFDLPDGNTGYNRASVERDYYLTTDGIEALKNNQFISESKELIEKRSERQRTKIVAWGGLLISLVLAIIKICESLAKM